MTRILVAVALFSFAMPAISIPANAQTKPKAQKCRPIESCIKNCSDRGGQARFCPKYCSDQWRKMGC